jgi:hypothetical protein
MNATVAGRVLETTAEQNREYLTNLFVELANEVAPRVNRRAIQRRTAEARLAGRLFDYDQVVNGYLGERSAAFYAGTRAAWQWNSRYWEQVALMRLSQYHSSPSSGEGKEALTEAVRHARHAVSIEHHPLPLTTLGKILLAQIGEQGISATATYEEAFGRLTAAINLERLWARINVHPFISLFRGTRTYIESGGSLTGHQAEQLRNLVRDAGLQFPADRDVQAAIAEMPADLRD